ncbi:DUF1254 domain-containing protein [Rudaea sp.]|uniref:DUF1254 domain-containing protein n=1 Tax=Rudaea sp. TaxID=2136325 RepID=UPI003783BD6F
MAAVATHVIVVHAIPHVLMQGAMDRIEKHVSTNKWVAAKRVTAASRTVVRPSPELAYSACVFDLRNGPVRMRVQPMNDYWSLSLFAANTDNFHVWDNRTAPSGVDIWLVADRAAGRQPPAGVTLVRSPSERGIALIRRRATSESQWPQIKAAQSEDRCEAVQ